MPTRGFLEAVFALQQFEVCGAREAIHALKLVGELLQRRKQAIKAAQFLVAAAARDRLERSTRAQPFGDRALCLKFALCRLDRGEIERNAENEDADADDSGRSSACSPSWTRFTGRS